MPYGNPTTIQTAPDAALRRTLHSLNDRLTRIEDGRTPAGAAELSLDRTEIDLSVTGQTTLFTPTTEGVYYMAERLDIWTAGNMTTVHTQPKIRVLRGTTEIASERTMYGFPSVTTFYFLRFDGGVHTITSDYPLILEVMTAMVADYPPVVQCDVIGRKLTLVE